MESEKTAVSVTCPFCATIQERGASQCVSCGKQLPADDQAPPSYMAWSLGGTLRNAVLSEWRKADLADKRATLAELLRGGSSREMSAEEWGALRENCDLYVAKMDAVTAKLPETASVADAFAALKTSPPQPSALGKVRAKDGRELAFTHIQQLRDWFNGGIVDASSGVFLESDKCWTPILPYLTANSEPGSFTPVQPATSKPPIWVIAIAVVSVIVTSVGYVWLERLDLKRSQKQVEREMADDMRQILNEELQDQLGQYKIAVNNKQWEDACVVAGEIKETFLAMHNEANYKEWTQIEKGVCSKAGL